MRKLARRDVITYKSVAQRDAAEFRDWLGETARDYQLQNLVLVGSPSSNGTIKLSLADAYREAEEVRGDGDAKAAAIYAAAYNQDAEFYAFYRSLGAYRESFSSKSDVLVLDPSSEFFRVMRNGSVGGK